MPAKNTYAWLFALAPLLSILVFAYGVWTYDEVPDALIKGGFIGLYIGLASADGIALKSLGVARVPSRWWSVLPPAYLIARARNLGQGWNIVAFWFVAMAVSLPMLQPSLLGAKAAMYAPTPSCGGMDSDVLHIFDTIPRIKATNAHGVRVTNPTQTAKIAAKRFCEAQVATSVGGDDVKISYSVDRRADGQLFLLIRLRE